MPYRSIRAAIVAIPLMLIPVSSWAQSSFVGVVRDTSGAVLPGVTIEAASPVLIEQVRTATSDDRGQYRIVGLRPGLYTVTFTLPGFSTVKREGTELPGDFAMTLNVDLQVGALEETVTVSGAAPTVDVQSTAKSQVVNREALDALPTGRSYHAIGQLLVGITTTKPDVGGSTSMQQSYLSLHGLSFTQNTIEVDGMGAAQSLLDGSNAQYWPQAYIQEMVYQTASISADATAGGLRANVVPRDGGNSYSGNVFVSGYPGRWVANNVTQDLKARGLASGNRSVFAYDTEAAIGGPLRRDRLWFFSNTRWYGLHTRVNGTYICENCYGKATAPSSGELGLDRQVVVPIYNRLTWQMSPRNKLAGYLNWIVKFRDGNMFPGIDPMTARQNFDYNKAYVAAIKWTSTVTNRLLVEAGMTPNVLTFVINQEPESRIPTYGSEAWFNTPQKTDIALGTTWNAAQNTLFHNERYYSKVSVSYVTGSHNFKAGALYDFGNESRTTTANADLVQRYRNGIPDSVSVLNTPRPYVDIYRIAGAFVQDTWTLGRLTMNPGIRFEYLNGGNQDQQAPAGRFVPERTFARVDDLPNWKTFAPRFGMAYDLFGNSKTALKFSLNRYDTQRTTGFANLYNPLAGANLSAILTWRDTNGDDIAQGPLGCAFLTTGCEINFAQLPAGFGQRSLNRPDPDIKRPYAFETSIGVQHEIAPRVSASASYLRLNQKNVVYTYNTNWTASDYTPVSVISPLDGSVFTVYNLDAAKVRQIDNLDTNSPEGKVNYAAYEFTLNGRLPGGLMLFGGPSIERTIQKNCDQPDNPNTLLFCDQGEHDIPWRTTLKLNGTYPLPWWQVAVAAAFQSYAPALLPPSFGGQTFNQVASPGSINWLISPTTRYAANCPGPCTPGALVVPGMTQAQLIVPLTPGNSGMLERVNQLDLSVNKTIKFGRTRTQIRFDAFNALNVSSVLTVRSSNFGTAAYQQPATILDGRTFRIGMQMAF